MKISVAFFIKTFLDGKGVGSVGGALSRQVGSVFASLGKLSSCGVSTHLLQCPVGRGQVCLQSPSPYDLAKYPPLSLAPAFVYPQLKNGSQCTSLL